MLTSFLHKIRKRLDEHTTATKPMRLCPYITGFSASTKNHLPFYRYERLPTLSSTRLFRLEPGSPHDTIQGSLETVDIDSAIAYCAVPYMLVSTDTPHAI